MNCKYTIKNFRVFDDKGATVDIRPITILTGCNSSGKSSIVKSLILLIDYISNLYDYYDVYKGIDFNKSKLDFTKSPSNSLGKFSRTLNSKSSSHTLSMEVTKFSVLLNDEVTIVLEFVGDESDVFTNGYLSSITFKSSNGNVIYSSNQEKVVIGDLTPFLDSYIAFVLCHIAKRPSQKTIFSRQIDIQKFTHEMNTFYCSEDVSTDRSVSFLNILNWQNTHENVMTKYKNSPHLKHEECINIIKNQSLFYLDVLEKFKEMNASSCKELLKNLSDSFEKDSEYADKLERIKCDYINSGIDNFYDYYLFKEHDFLSEILELRIDSSKKTVSPSLSSKYLRKTDYGDSPLMNILEPACEKFVIGNKELSFMDIYDCVQHLETPGLLTKFRMKKYADYLTTCLEDIFFKDMEILPIYISSSNVNVKRVYPLEAGDEFTNLLKRYFESKRLFNASNRDYLPDTFMTKWLSSFGICSFLRIEVTYEGWGATIKVYESKDDIEGRLLAELGYGATQLFSTILAIEVAILETNQAEEKYFVEEYSSRNHKIASVYIEEPENHLHPSMQSQLADMFADAYLNYGVHLMIETHSEYLIRKFQTIVAQNDSTSIQKEDISIIYVDHPDSSKRKDQNKQIRQIYCDEDGQLTDDFGTGFFDEAGKLAMDLYR